MFAPHSADAEAGIPDTTHLRTLAERSKNVPLEGLLCSHIF